MKILQINKYYYHKGGAETVFFNTSHLLERYGHTVIPFSLKSKKNLPSPYEDYFVDYPELSESGLFTKLKHVITFVYNKKAARQLDKLLKAEKPDIAHIHLMFNSFSASILPILKKHNIPVIMSAHDSRLICPAYAFTDGKGNICEKCLKGASYWHCIANRCSRGNFFNSVLLALDSYFRKYCIRPLDYIDKFIFVGDFGRNKHIQANPLYEAKSTVLHNFTTIEGEPADKEDYIIYFGRISVEKGILVLLEAMKCLPEVKIKIVGTGPLLEELQQQQYDNIEFIGYKSGIELSDLIRKALFVVAPSVCYENNTMVIPEGYTLGTPAIASRIGGIPEFIQQGENGYLFEPGSVEQLRNTIIKALKLSPEEYSTMCKKALSFAHENFTGEAYYNKLMKIYNEVINNKKA